MDWNAQLQILGEVALAVLFGGVIGFEREVADKPAGLRTHMLIAGAAALLTGVGHAMIFHLPPNSQPNGLRADPLRIIEAIITGISFLGAGTIIHHRGTNQVEGLTTAASILFSAAQAICVALQLFLLAVGVTALGLFILRVVGRLEGKLERKQK